jgi:hypothetical protein
MSTLKVGDHVWSAFFNQVIKVSAVRSDDDWEFELPNGERYPADTPLSYFEDKRITQ